MLPWDPLWRLRHVGYPVSPRGYRGLPAFASLSMAGSDCARVRHDFHSEVKAFVADGAKERIVVLTPNAASMRQCREGHLPADPLHVRLIRVELESGEVEVLITSLRDTKAYPYCAFAKLYALRWGIEERGFNSLVQRVV